MDIKVVIEDITQVQTGALIVNHFENVSQLEGATASLDKALKGAISALIEQGDIKGKPGEITLIPTLGAIPAKRVAVIGLGKKTDLTPNKIRAAMAEICRWLRQRGVNDIATLIHGTGVNGISLERASQALTEGALLGLYTFRRHKTDKENGLNGIGQLSILSSEKEKPFIEQAVNKATILAEAANWARDLVNEPSNFLTPSRMAEYAREIAEKNGLSIEIFDRDEIEKMGMGGLLGVSKGSQQLPKFMVLNYKGDHTDEIGVALVGKGITFDSGGISIKPSEGMSDMKGDMAGGASVLAAISAISQLKAKINVVAIVPATENMPSGTAQKPGDVIAAMNGKTIEVLNTDAEGRLILADALSYAVKLGAKRIIDVATLTGACHVALGSICTGAFANNQELADAIIDAGSETGEFMWQMPMFDEYKEDLKSDIADIKNIGGRYGGAITAAKFLSEFVANTPWVHLDIAGTFDTDKEKGYLVKGATGIPVRTLVDVVISLSHK
jgi:leucyl aminopeptidase